ncbi:uncharacterized protein BJ212DRAFT_1276239 [Suillus subaureus]|uniref:Uncharacterized protein n=1 Tax=Suillus subaureus TaxID=48587 RepID=A0A9P7E6U5_9AGAM|nr:uncharacterized protein BJ212DRAFT_1276239 [Suillus subaureus]KAG1812894.1 hypothetical protein BJ212DRAFT_1276239 [Suillus subaureus]
MVSTGIPLDTAAIISTALEGILYGFSVLMFMGTMWVSIYHKPSTNHPLALAAILLLILSTAHLVIDIIRLEDGFVKYRDTFPGGPVAFFQDISQPTFVTKNLIYALQTMIGDGVVIYRCYAVWQSLWVIILPSILWCGSSVAALIAPYYASQATGGNIYTNQTAQWITVLFVLTLSTNLISSGLLVYRIWMTERRVSANRATNGTMMPIVHVLIDAAIIYSAALFTILICFVCANNAQFIMLDMIMPIISIAFCMVLIRLTPRKITPSYFPTFSMEINERERRDSQQYPMKPLQVHVSQWIHNDGME